MNHQTWIVLLFLIFIPGCKQANDKFSILHNGDLIFQRRNESRYRVMNFIAGSIYNHCGLILKKNHEFYVLSAEASVKLMPLSHWINLGVNHKYSIYRLKPDNSINLDLVLKMALLYKGRVYDYKFDWDDSKVYNAELIQKAFIKGAGIYLGEIQKLEELFIAPEDSVDFKQFNGYIPVGKEIITVHSILNSERIFQVMRY